MTVLRYAGKAVVAVGVLLGYLSYLQPRMSVTPREALDSSKPFSVPFTISNDSYLSFRNVVVRCGMEDVKGEEGKRISGGLAVEASDSISHIAAIYPGASATVSCNFVLSQAFGPLTVTSADIAILVQYRPVYLPWSKTRGFRFVTDETSDHRLVWQPQPELPDKSRR